MAKIEQNTDAYYTVCEKNLFSNMGVASLESHLKSSKHPKLMKARERLLYYVLSFHLRLVPAHPLLAKNKDLPSKIKL